MNSCNVMQAKFTEYLDGRLTGREMQRIAARLARRGDGDDPGSLIDIDAHELPVERGRQ